MPGHAGLVLKIPTISPHPYQHAPHTWPPASSIAMRAGALLACMQYTAPGSCRGNGPFEARGTFLSQAAQDARSAVWTASPVATEKPTAKQTTKPKDRPAAPATVPATVARKREYATMAAPVVEPAGPEQCSKAMLAGTNLCKSCQTAMANSTSTTVNRKLNSTSECSSNFRCCAWNLKAPRELAASALPHWW